MDFRYNNDITIPADDILLQGDLVVPMNAEAIIIFAHGSGSSRNSPRNLMVARYLQQHNFGTLLFDLLTEQEDRDYDNRFDIELLTGRLITATAWLEARPAAKGTRLGYFGASTGAASALRASAALPEIGAVVSRGGRPDLAMDWLPRVKAPVLLIVGSQDRDVLKLNEAAFARLDSVKKIEIVNGATHLFEEPGTMEMVCKAATAWFSKYLLPVKVS